MTHYLKCVQPYFDEVCLEIKKFEVRFNDRNYKVGDTLSLQEYDAESNLYTGREIRRVVSYILDDSKFCKEGFVIMGIDAYKFDAKGE